MKYKTLYIQLEAKDSGTNSFVKELKMVGWLGINENQKSDEISSLIKVEINKEAHDFLMRPYFEQLAAKSKPNSEELYFPMVDASGLLDKLEYTPNYAFIDTFNYSSYEDYLSHGSYIRPMSKETYHWNLTGMLSLKDVDIRQEGDWSKFIFYLHSELDMHSKTYSDHVMIEKLKAKYKIELC